jgi:hypothetical protein
MNNKQNLHLFTAPILCTVQSAKINMADPTLRFDDSAQGWQIKLLSYRISLLNRMFLLKLNQIVSKSNQMTSTIFDTIQFGSILTKI